MRILQRRNRAGMRNNALSMGLSLPNARFGDNYE
jgi:hypothetical protein